MNLRRALGSLIATTLVASALGVVAAAAPASALEGTVITTYSSSGTWIYSSSSQQQPGSTVYGSQLYYNVAVLTTTGGYVSEGVTTLQRLAAGSTTWETVDETTGSTVSGYLPASTSATYRVLYSGTANYAPATAEKVIEVQRKLSVQNKGKRTVLLVGKVGPKYHGKVTILKQAGKKWKKWKVLRTNKKSVFKSPLPAPRRGRYYWRVVIKPSGGFAATDSGKFWTYSY